MAITKRNPYTIHLAGPIEIVDDEDFVASGAISPGHLVELHDDGSNIDVRVNGSATEIVAMSVALERAEMNRTIDDDYVAGEAVKFAYLRPGSIFYGLIPSGQNISRAELLASNADGTFVTAPDTTEGGGVAKFQSLDNLGSISTETRCRIMVIQ